MKSFIFTALLVFLIVPLSASAYLTVAQDAIKIGNRGVVYSVTYDFGSPKYEFRMPIEARLGNEIIPHQNAVEYVLKNDEGNSPMLNNDPTAMVLSAAKIENGYYVVPRGEARRFMLVAAVPFAEMLFTYNDSDRMGLHVTNLPFVMVDRDGTERLGKLNPSELQYYRTPVARVYRTPLEETAVAHLTDRTDLNELSGEEIRGE